MGNDARGTFEGFRKLCFEALETQFGVKKAKFGGLRAKLGHLKSIKAEELT